VDMARSNGITPDKLAHCAERSAASLTGLLPSAGAGETAANLDGALGAALQTCITQLNSNRTLLKPGTLNKDGPIVEKALRILAAGERIAWPDWARLAKLGTTKADAPLFAEVIAAAAAHPRHPGLRTDIEDYIRLIFDCAMRCMTAYAEY